MLLKSAKNAAKLVYIRGCREALNDWAGVWTAVVAIVAFIVMLVLVSAVNVREETTFQKAFL